MKLWWPRSSNLGSQQAGDSRLKKARVSVQVWRPENQEKQWYKFPFKGQQDQEPKLDVSGQVQKQEKTDVPAQESYLQLSGESIFSC